MDQLGSRGPAGLRVATAGLVGAGVGVATYLPTQRLAYAPAVGWITAAAVYLTWTWLLIFSMDATATEDHAVHHEKDGNRHTAHVIVVAASMASLAGVGFLLYATSSSRDRPDLAAGAVGVLSVFASWFAVHTVFALRYARLYYNASDPESRGIEFNGDPPTYLDFAYFAFTIGMCFGVSDNSLTTRDMRATVLSHAMVSYLLGTVTIAITLNLVGGLAG